MARISSENAFHLHPIERLLEDVKNYVGDVLFYDGASWPLGWLDDQLEAHRRASSEGLEKLSEALADLREMRRLASEYNKAQHGTPCACLDEAVRVARVLQQGNKYSLRFHHIRWARSKGFTVERHPAWEGAYLLLRHPTHSVECTVDVSREVYELALIDALVADAGNTNRYRALDAVRLLAEKPDEPLVVSAFWLSTAMLGAAFRAEQVASDCQERGLEQEAQTFAGMAQAARVLSETAKAWGDDDVEIRRVPEQNPKARHEEKP